MKQIAIIWSVLVIQKVLAASCSFDLRFYDNTDCSGDGTLQYWRNMPVGYDTTAVTAEVEGSG